MNDFFHALAIIGENMKKTEKAIFLPNYILHVQYGR